MSQLYKAPLTGEKIGVVFGAFAPAHLGHYHNIIRAKKENDGAVVIVSGRAGDRGDVIGLSLLKRFQYMRELFADDEKVYVTMLDEGNIPVYPNGWEEWLLLADDCIKQARETKPRSIIFYVGEAEYVKELTTRRHVQVKKMNRGEIDISATQIRNNPLKHWHEIMQPFRGFFSTNILIMGTASTGKTTLTQDMAKSFGSPFSDEYARRYQEIHNVRDEELTVTDFLYLGSGQFENNNNHIMSPANHGLFIADTDVMVTKVYAKYYLSAAEYKVLVPMFDTLIAQQKWNMIFVIPPVTTFVDDHFRDMSYQEDEERWKFHEMFMEELAYQGLMEKMIILDAPFNKHAGDDKEGFYGRYMMTRKAIKDYVKATYKLELR